MSIRHLAKGNVARSNWVFASAAYARSAGYRSVCRPRRRKDSTLLSKIDLGERAPTQTQLAALAKFFGVAARPLEARRLAEEMLKSHGDNPAFAEATAIIREAAGEYPVKKVSAGVGKSRTAVNKGKKSK
jgi:hypothetical protein